MSEKKEKSFVWPFVKIRQEKIASADSLIAEAAEVKSRKCRFTEDGSPTSKAAVEEWKRAARLYERASSIYTSAGMGLQAQRSLEDAADTYGSVGEEVSQIRCQLSASSIMVFYA